MRRCCSAACGIGRVDLGLCVVPSGAALEWCEGGAGVSNWGWNAWMRCVWGACRAEFASANGVGGCRRSRSGGVVVALCCTVVAWG